MSSTFHLEVVTPDRKFFDGNVLMVIVPAVDGSLGILWGHEPMVTVIKEGLLRIKCENNWSEASISSGFIEVKPDYAIVFADSVEWPYEIDEKRALAAKERAEERLRQKLSRIEYLRTQAAIRRALVRLTVKREK